MISQNILIVFVCLKVGHILFAIQFNSNYVPYASENVDIFGVS